VNPITFTDFGELDICGLGTQISPLEPGAYTALIQAIDTEDVLGGFLFDGNTNSEAPYVGIESELPMTSVEVSIQSTSGVQKSFYAINQVDLRVCPSGPEVPVVSCNDGLFFAPMDKFPVRAKKNRVFPLKMELFDADGEVTDADLNAAPVVEVMFSSTDPDDESGVIDEVLAAGQGTDGNQFVYTEEGIWHFNLKSKDHSAKGTYTVTVVSGDEAEYTIDPSCVTEFVMQ
jgi:hypothetical protein